MSYNETLEDRIDHYLIDNEKLIKNKTMGMVGWLLNGNMCFGIFGDKLIVRLNKSLAHALTKKKGIELFRQDEETPGVIISIAPKLYENQEVFQKFIDKSMEYTATLPSSEEDVIQLDEQELKSLNRQRKNEESASDSDSDSDSDEKKFDGRYFDEDDLFDGDFGGFTW